MPTNVTNTPSAAGNNSTNQESNHKPSHFKF